MHMSSHSELLVVHLVLLNAKLVRQFILFETISHFIDILPIGFVLSLEQFILSKNLAFELFIFSLNDGVLFLHFIMTLMQASFNVFE